MKKGTTRNYHFAIAILYSILKFAWNLYGKYWESFAPLSDVYTEEYGQNQLTAIAAAQAMPDNEQRQGSKQNTGNKLKASCKKGVTVWKQLRQFIIKSVEPADLDTALKQAGLAHFEKIASYNYGEVSLLLSDGLTFLTGNTAVLEKGGMPARFIEAYAAAKTAFDNQQALYGAAKGNATNGKNDKIAANNALYTSLTLMLADAATIFEEQPEIQKQFTLVAIERLITTDGVSGIHFLVRNSETKQPLETAAISIVGQQKPFPVNKRGALEIKLPKATYYFSVTVPGYPMYNGQVVLDANVMRRAEVLVTKTESSTAIS